MLGDERCEPTIQAVILGVGDKIILTSDGVHDNLIKDEIEKVLNGGQSNLAEELVQRAKTRSKENHIRAKPDDISAIVVEVG